MFYHCPLSVLIHIYQYRLSSGPRWIEIKEIGGIQGQVELVKTIFPITFPYEGDGKARDMMVIVSKVIKGLRCFDESFVYLSEAAHLPLSCTLPVKALLALVNIS